MKIFQKTNLWRGLAAIFAFLLAVVIAATSIALSYSTMINGYFNITPYIVDTENVDPDLDTAYFKSQFGEKTRANLTELEKALKKQGIVEAEEGAVLLKNAIVGSTPALPLAATERRVTLFGRHSIPRAGQVDGYASGYMDSRTNSGPVYKGASAGVTKFIKDYRTALTEAGFVINQDLLTKYAAITDLRERPNAAKPFTYRVSEAPIATYTPEIKATWATDYQTAIVLITRNSGEDGDIPTLIRDVVPAHAGAATNNAATGGGPSGDITTVGVGASTGNDLNDVGKNGLELTKNEEDMFALIKDEKAAGRIKKTIVLLNTNTPMEAHWFDAYNVDAALWIGLPGDDGFTGVANILTGAANPSGKLADVFPTNAASAPALVNGGTEGTNSWTNYVERQSQITAAGSYLKNTAFYTTSVEGIYLGYKYYETRYEDTVLNRYGANNSAGSSDGQGWSWAKEVTYPLGYGLSYTNFTQTLGAVTYDAATDTYKVPVTVKNVGSSVKGKSVVQVYAQTPYGEYERTNLIEKSAVQLVNYGKTKLLDPQESQTLTIDVDKYLLASYDSKSAKGYVLSQGDYYLAIGNDSHDALNNILAKKRGSSGLVGLGGAAVTGDTAKAHTWNESLDTVKYQYSKIWKEDPREGGKYTYEKGTRVTNRFDDADINYYQPGKVTYMTRKDWSGTFPKESVKVALNDPMIKPLAGSFYEAKNDSKVSDYTFGAENNLSLVMMKDVPYDDNIMWNKFLDQIKDIDELINQTGGLSYYKAAPSVSKPIYSSGDGGDGGISGPITFTDGTAYSEGFGTTASQKATFGYCFPAQIVIGCTWSPALQSGRGDMIGEIGVWTGRPTSFAPGGNIHRTAFSGRNYEYSSEDPTLAYWSNYYISSAMQKRGVLSGIKHVAGNDQEYRRQGLSVFFTEQTYRETCLRAEEGSLRLAKSNLLMQSFNRLGVTMSSASYALCAEVIHNEWGFRGFQETDAIQHRTGYLANWAEQLEAGTDTGCFINTTSTTPDIKKLIVDNDDGYLLSLVRQSAKDVFYGLSRSSLINGLAPGAVLVPITPWWETALYWTIAGASVLFVAGLAMFVLSERKIFKKKGDA